LRVGDQVCSALPNHRIMLPYCPVVIRLVNNLDDSDDEYWYHFFIQVQALDATSGKPIWLDISVPRPRQMTCNYLCVAVYSLNASAGATKHKRCTAVVAQVGWELRCDSGNGV
jgi:hypothetical protein